MHFGGRPGRKLGPTAKPPVRTSRTEERWPRVSPLEGVSGTGWDVCGGKFGIVVSECNLGREGVPRWHLERGGGPDVLPYPFRTYAFQS